MLLLPSLKELLNVMITRKLLHEKSLCTENLSSFLLTVPTQVIIFVQHIRHPSLEEITSKGKAIEGFIDCVSYILLCNKSPPKPSDLNVNGHFLFLLVSVGWELENGEQFP